ncbi:hypothetical protein NFIA_078450 [Paecilomyces variotii No. 5]|uniref:Uncharacterized protein n=1 Tax=Byssochlamys spectabilis (strain No. 5 / NBRC 109023) TaxID=1356009 RepID=V5G6N4_BYSSN|nr:hypothetical protein NFIA_078450 [Paecilomyces variotii No. 5]
MAATLSGTYNSAPDTPSPVYPDRLIRPLPKRPLRSRLSPEAAESILYPPAPPVTQLFYGAYTENGDVVNDAKVYVQQNVENYGQECSTDGDHHHPYENGVDCVSDDEDGPVMVRRSAGFRGASLSPSAAAASRQAYPGNADSSQTKPSSGPDGYDAFENTNNKKKRKIPTSGNLGSHHSTLSADLANMGISSSASSAASALGFLDPEEVALDAVLLAAAVAGFPSLSTPKTLGQEGEQQHWSLARASGCSLTTLVGDTGSKTDQGIISAAIANAAALSSSPKGQENVSLLDQQTKKTTPTKTQFTFTCESDSSKGMALQTNPFPLPQHPRSPNAAISNSTQNPHGGVAIQGTQTSPNMATQTNHAATQQQQAQGSQSNAQPKKTRRSPSSIYALAARQRKIQQQYANLHHPPNPEDIWICEFCEYEAIFGHPPEALIRQYEIKDRKERKRLAEKRRLLEKAKMKGRKGKKATKNAAKNAAATHPQGYDRHPEDPAAVDSHGSHGDDYLDHEYDEEPIPIPPPPHQAPVKHPVPNGNTVNEGTISADTRGVAGGGTDSNNRPGS